MNEIGINDVLAQMQRLAAQARSSTDLAPTGPASAGSGSGAAIADAVSGPGEFAELLKASIEQVNEAQSRASDMAAAFEHGDPAASLPEVMIALQKASLSFQAMTEVRNRLVSAYQEVMSMPI